MKLQDMTWPEVARLDRERALVLAPLAACEQHSRHLPTFTDAILCGAVAGAVEKSMPERVLLLPVLWLGASDHHFPFGATLSVSVDTHIQLVAELLTPLLDDGFKRFLILNGHGGNIDTLHAALRRLQPRYPDRLLAGASYWELAEEELAKLAAGERKHMGHACEFETSMMMHFRPDLVRAGEIKNDHQAKPRALRGLYVAEDMSQRTGQGCVGYPEAATRESGRRFADAIIERVTEVCRHLADEKIVAGRRNAKQ
jgi:creatinine amidohydrolase